MEFVTTFLFFFAVIDPIGTVPVFVAVTEGLDRATKRAIAIKATVFSALILVFFIVAGEFVLRAVAVPLEAFQIFGGSVLFLFALTMIFGEGKPEGELRLAEDSHEKAIYPLAMPSIAGPGAIVAAMLSTKNADYTVAEQLQTTGSIIAVLLCVLILLLGSSWVDRLLGKAGAGLVSRIMGLIFGSVAVSNILQGISGYFSL